MKKWMTKLLLAVMIAALMVTCTACGDAEKEQLEQENAALQAQLDDLNARLEALENRTGLKDWSMTASAWSSANGATVTLTAVPGNYQSGQTALFSVRLNGQEVVSSPCDWDGTSYTGVAEVEAADGYSYYCTLVSADGTKEQIALNTPENTVDDTLVYLESSLVTYGNIIVEDWEGTEEKLTLTSGYIQVQLPRISAGGSVDMDKAELVFQLNAEELQRKPLDLPAGEGEGSYEVAFQDISFDMPEMENDYQLDLWLEVTLTDGQVISTPGGSWYFNGSELLMVVG